MQILLLASSNPGKIIELQPLLLNIPIKLVTPADMSISVDVDENANTYKENASLKAKAYCNACGLPTLADDTGLEVEALGGLPGVHSARFTGLHSASDLERRSLLLNKLQVHPRPWLARFVCSVAVAFPDGKMLFGEGECPGEISPSERGTNGFGYDPIFLVHAAGRTMAELTLVEKNVLSHRALAVKSVLPQLKNALSVTLQ
jgi:XTP/dITP diphosphohydrolase